MNINDLNKEELVAAIQNGDDLTALNAFIEMPKTILSDIVPDYFPDSHIPEYKSVGGTIIPKTQITFDNYLWGKNKKVAKINEENTCFLIAYRIPDNRTMAGLPDADVRIFLDYFCDANFSNLYTEKDGIARIKELYRL